MDTPPQETVMVRLEEEGTALPEEVLVLLVAEVLVPQGEAETAPRAKVVKDPLEEEAVMALQAEADTDL